MPGPGAYELDREHSLRRFAGRRSLLRDRAAQPPRTDWSASIDLPRAGVCRPAFWVARFLDRAQPRWRSDAWRPRNFRYRPRPLPTRREPPPEMSGHLLLR